MDDIKNTDDTKSVDNQESDSDKRIAELIRTNGILKANISTLYRTARAEIDRKNKMIAELQAQLDDLIFRRKDRRAEVERNMNELIDE